MATTAKISLTSSSSDFSEAWSIRSPGCLIASHFYTSLYVDSILCKSVYKFRMNVDCFLTPSCSPLFSRDFEKGVVLTRTDLAHPPTSLHSASLSSDSDLCLFIPLLMDIFNFIFLTTVNIFGMQKNFFRINTTKMSC